MGWQMRLIILLWTIYNEAICERWKSHKKILNLELNTYYHHDHCRRNHFDEKFNPQRLPYIFFHCCSNTEHFFLLLCVINIQCWAIDFNVKSLASWKNNELNSTHRVYIFYIYTIRCITIHVHNNQQQQQQALTYRSEETWGWSAIKIDL